MHMYIHAYSIHMSASGSVCVYIDTTPLVTMGTLDDIDRDYSKLGTQPQEDEFLELHATEGRIT